MEALFFSAIFFFEKSFWIFYDQKKVSEERISHVKLLWWERSHSLVKILKNVIKNKLSQLCEPFFQLFKLIITKKFSFKKKNSTIYIQCFVVVAQVQKQKFFFLKKKKKMKKLTFFFFFLTLLNLRLIEKKIKLK